MLQARHGSRAWQDWEQRNEAVLATQREYDDDAIAGRVAPTYRFDFGVLGDTDVQHTAQSMRVGEYEIDLDLANPYSDMCS